MRNLLFILIIALAFLVSGCGANIRTYTFKVDRSDQELSGNRGYVMGGAPPEEIREKPKRTIVGIDIELPTREEFIEETGLRFPKKSD